MKQVVSCVIQPINLVLEIVLKNRSPKQHRLDLHVRAWTAFKDSHQPLLVPRCDTQSENIAHPFFPIPNPNEPSVFCQSVEGSPKRVVIGMLLNGLLEIEPMHPTVEQLGKHGIDLRGLDA